MINLLDITGFEWDEGNKIKSVLKHKVTQREVEELFENVPIMFAKSRVSVNEERLLAYGRTDSGRSLTAVFAIRENKIRIISARPQSKNERREYEEYSKKEVEADSRI